jgi:hypothetical protein
MGIVPAGMYNPEMIEFQKQGKGLEPIEEIRPFAVIVPELLKGFDMLCDLF